MKIILLTIVFLNCGLYAQERFIVVHSPFEQSADTIPFVEFDDTIERDRTDYYIGDYNKEIVQLPQVPATEGLFDKGSFTRKKVASDVYNINKFPIRTSVKLFSMHEGKLYQFCSGSLVGDNYVLTAAHCVSEIGENYLLGDSIFIAPVYNNGEFSTQFEASYVNKIFFLKDWRFGGTDIALLQLEKSIGQSTGWLSIGFDKVDSSFQDGIFFKFSYPGTISPIDSTFYNGDTLFYGYGYCDYLGKIFYGAKGAHGVPGESGSAFIKIVNDRTYLTYGAASLAYNLNHSRMTNDIFYTLKSILEDDFVTDIEVADNPSDYSLYPNPANSTIKLRTPSNSTIKQITIVDSQGRVVKKFTNIDFKDDLDISYLSTGLYYIRIENGNEIQILNFIKL